jgi:hypothetical protein
VTAREARAYELAHQRHLFDTYMPTCVAAKYEQSELDQLEAADIYFLATAVQNAVKNRAKYVVVGCFGSHDYLGALRSMTTTELQEMRRTINYKPCRTTRS